MLDPFNVANRVRWFGRLNPDFIRVAMENAIENAHQGREVLYLVPSAVMGKRTQESMDRALSPASGNVRVHTLGQKLHGLGFDIILFDPRCFTPSVGGLATLNGYSQVLPGKRKIREVPLGQIVYDSLPLNPTGFATAMALRMGVSMPPVKLQDLGDGRFRLLDGRHRYLAHKLNGRKTIRARSAWGTAPKKG